MVAASKGVVVAADSGRQDEDRHPPDRPRLLPRRPRWCSRTAPTSSTGTRRRSPRVRHAGRRLHLRRRARCFRSGRATAISRRNARLVFGDDAIRHEIRAARLAAQLPPQVVLNIATLGPDRHAAAGAGDLGLGGRRRSSSSSASPSSAYFEYLLISAAALAYLAVGICGQAEIQLGTHDPGEVILDEFVAMPLCFYGWRLIARDPAAPCASVLLWRASSSSGSSTSGSPG